MADILKPESESQLADAINWAQSESVPLAVKGQGTKDGLGRPTQTRYTLDMTGFSGIDLYEPEELVLTAKAGTPIAEIQQALADKNQELRFEPGDLGRLYGHAPGGGTLGGLVAANWAGPRRIKDGAARDHVLGIKGVTGRGEFIKSGGRVVKNVSGYDLPKLITGAHGTLMAMTEITVKVLPAPEKIRTVLLIGLSAEDGRKAMSRALGSPHEVSGAAHVPATAAAMLGVDPVTRQGAAVTAIRVEGPGPSVEHRCAELIRELGGELGGATEELHTENSKAFWKALADLEPLVQQQDKLVWKISVAPTRGPALVDTLGLGDSLHWLDWGGGLIWLGLDGSDSRADAIRSTVDAAGGHATLIRAPEPTRAATEVFHPLPDPLMGLSRRTKEGFDPNGLLNPGRMYPGF
ncbi:MAG: glycolate oxidase subunit GlcE [Alphaproteobacteria bacterium]|nr:glycolate oxidase subunit GlcE [Alphaproteobacteria bacterium]